MGIFRLVKSINNLLDDKDHDSVCLDLGERFIKCLLAKDKKIKGVFVEESKTNKVKAAAELLKKKGLAGKKVNLSLKGPDTLTRYIGFPKLDKAKLRESFGYELSKYIPFKPEAVYFDLFVLDENYSKEENLILVAVVKKDLVDSLLEEFAQERITVSTITLNNLALINLHFATKGSEINTALLDIGYSSSILTLIKKNRPYLSREIKISTKILIEKLAANQKLEPAAAEEFLIGSASEPLELGEELFSELADEMRNSFDYFEMNAGEQIKQIHLCGGLAAVKGIEKTIEASVGTEVKPWAPWEGLNIKFPKQLPAPKEMLTVVMGLNL